MACCGESLVELESKVGTQTEKVKVAEKVDCDGNQLKKVFCFSPAVMFYTIHIHWIQNNSRGKTSHPRSLFGYVNMWIFHFFVFSKLLHNAQLHANF